MRRLFLTLLILMLPFAAMAQEGGAGPETRRESVFEPTPQRLFEDEYENMGWADFDQDGDADVALHHRESGQQLLTLYRNDGGMEFTPSEVFQLTEGELSRITFDDIDGDGYPDLLLAREDGPNSIHRNDGSGSFENRGVMLGLQVDETDTLIGSDIDGDGDNDLIAVNVGRTKRYLNESHGQFTSGRSINREYQRGEDAAAVDLDGDGDVDLLLATRNNGILLFRNYGDGTFDADGIDISGVGVGSAFALALADADGDADLDLFAAERSDLNFLRNQGDGTFDAPVSLEGESYVALGDLDLDGDIDVVTSPTYVVLNDGSGQWIQTERIINFDHTEALALQDIDNDDDLDLVILRRREWGVLVYFNKTISPAGQQ